MGKMKGQWTVLYHRDYRKSIRVASDQLSSAISPQLERSYHSKPIIHHSHPQHRSGEPIVWSCSVSPREGEKREQQQRQLAQGLPRLPSQGIRRIQQPVCPSPLQNLSFLSLSPFYSRVSNFHLYNMREARGGHNYSFKLSCPLGNMLKDRSSQILIKVQIWILPQIHKNIFPNSCLNRKLIFPVNILKQRDMAH